MDGDAEDVRRQSPGGSRRKVTHARQLTTDAATSARLGRVRQAGTAPELVVRRALNALGVRFRVRNRDLPGAPDIANRSRRWAIWVHGCFWHAHQGCPRATVPKRNRDFWLGKFEANRSRDLRVAGELNEMGFQTIVVWECETRDAHRLRARLCTELVARRCSDLRTIARAHQRDDSLGAS
jgi:DNA mismatch endonuclease (patch repair protein)